MGDQTQQKPGPDEGSRFPVVDDDAVDAEGHGFRGISHPRAVEPDEAAPKDEAAGPDNGIKRY